MKIIRFFLSNILLIAFFCGVIYVYYYWDNLTGEDTPAGQAIAYLSKEFKEVGEFVEGIKRKQSEEAIAVVDDVATEKDLDIEADKALATKEVASIEAVETNDDVFVTPEIEQSLNRAVVEPTNAQAITSLSTAEANVIPDSNRSLWIKARKAFYTRNFEESISSYEQLIANTRDNFDAHGELGNVYFNQGKKIEAAAAYFEAAAILVRLDQARRAESLMSLLNYLDAEKASQLKELIAAQKS